MPAGLTIRLGDSQGNVSVETLAKTLHSALKTLRSLGEQLAPSGSAIDWEIVRVSMRSPLTVTIGPRSNGRATRRIGGKITRTCVLGIEQMEKRAALPPHFSVETADAVKEMVSVAEGDGKKITLSTSKKTTVSPTSNMVANVTEIVSKSRRYVDYGTIEGVMEEISIHEGTSIVVWESLTNHPVLCRLDPERLQEAMACFGKRVAVSGAVRYVNHRPMSMEVEEPIRVFRPDSELPQIGTMPPIDITGGIPSEIYVRRMRDAR